MRVAVLTIKGCPHVQSALKLVRGALAEVGRDADVELVEVAPNQVDRRRFLGSPSIRVDDVDIEPGASSRDTFGHGCRLYRTPDGLSPLPDIEWLRGAIARAP